MRNDRPVKQSSVFSLISTINIAASFFIFFESCKVYRYIPDYYLNFLILMFTIFHSITSDLLKIQVISLVMLIADKFADYTYNNITKVGDMPVNCVLV